MSTKDSPSGIVRSYYRGIETDLTLQQLEQLYKELEAYFFNRDAVQEEELPYTTR